MSHDSGASYVCLACGYYSFHPKNEQWTEEVYVANRNGGDPLYTKDCDEAVTASVMQG